MQNTIHRFTVFESAGYDEYHWDVMSAFCCSFPPISHKNPGPEVWQITSYHSQHMKCSEGTPFGWNNLDQNTNVTVEDYETKFHRCGLFLLWTVNPAVRIACERHRVADDWTAPCIMSSLPSLLKSSVFELEERFKTAMTLPTKQLETSGMCVWEDSGVDDLTQKDLDILVARDMNGLTRADREENMQELHGVGGVALETPDFVFQHRLLLDRELSSLVSRRTSRTGAFERARQQNFADVASEHFQLLFLRSTKWDAKEAATRMVGFFETKEVLFGTSKLTERIELSHLTKEDQHCLETGFCQLLPVRDTAGRAILVLMVPLISYKNVETLKRTYFYMNMVALEDVETQRRGIVMVSCSMGPSGRVDRKAVFALHSTQIHLPVRLASGHYCFDDFKLRSMLAIPLLLAAVSTRVRLRNHYGTSQEVLYQLSTYGIPVSSLPVADDGESKSKNHKQWLKARALQEMKQSCGSFQQMSIVVVPGRLDVLLGRGKPIQEHIGNLHFHALMDVYQNTYERAKKFEKRSLAEKVALLVAEYGGRFLKQEGAGWLEVDHAVAREKVGHAFRTRRASFIADKNIASSNPHPDPAPSDSRGDSKHERAEEFGLDKTSLEKKSKAHPAVSSIITQRSKDSNPNGVR